MVTINDSSAGVTRWSTSVVRRPHLSLAPTSLSFANQSVGTTSAALPLTLNNRLARSGELPRTTTTARHAAGSRTCTIQLTFAPTTVGVNRIDHGHRQRDYSPAVGGRQFGNYQRVTSLSFPVGSVASERRPSG